MKIKEVCEQTTLTTRTVRLYIEEKLISPEYSENYLGRKSFNFSDEDVKILLNIATLRKYGFSIAEIRQIIETKNNSAWIIKNICNRKAKTIQNEEEMLTVLSKLNNGRIYSLEEIANALNTCQEKRDLPKDDTMSAFLLLLRNPKQLIMKILAIADKFLLLASFGVSIYFIIYYFAEWKYPHFYDVTQGLLYLFLTSIPALIVFSIWLGTKIISRIVLKSKSISGIGFVSSILVILSLLPICVIGLIRPVESLTTDIKNYREIDEYESRVCNNSFYNELFPISPKGAVRENNELIYPDSNYYYRCKATFDFTMDIFAEWGLEKTDFYKEIDRVKNLYSAYELLDVDKADYEYNEFYYKYAEFKKGDYICLIRYDGGTPFNQEEDDYYYFIFAYNEDDLRVRYILCHSREGGADQPYYLQLDW